VDVTSIEDTIAELELRIATRWALNHTPVLRRYSVDHSDNLESQSRETIADLSVCCESHEQSILDNYHPYV
jgi:hypothetical protein